MSHGTVVIMQGVSGSGKSTYAKRLTDLTGTRRPDFMSWVGAWADLPGDHPWQRPGVIVSADNYFTANGKYNFDARLLNQAHQTCFRSFIQAVSRQDRINGSVKPGLVIVDNTNTSVAEVAPYVLAGEAYGYVVEIVRIDCPVDVAAARTIHGVPREKIESQRERMLDFNIERNPLWRFKIVGGQTL